MGDASVWSENFNLILIVVLFSLILQIFLSSLISCIIFRHKNKEFFMESFLAITIIPSIVYVVGWIQLLKDDGLIGEALKRILDTGIIELIASNTLIFIIFIAFFSAIPWIGFYVIMFTFFSRAIPQSIYDLAKLENIHGKLLIKYVYMPFLKPVFPIFILAVIISSFSVFHVTYYFNLLSGTNAGENYLDWSNLLASGVFDITYTFLSIFVSLIIGVGLFLAFVLLSKRKGDFF